MTHPAVKPVSAREAAREAITAANFIFICYSHRDLSAVKKLHARLLRLRPGHDAASVFRDQDGLRPGADVSPAVIDARIRQADLFVLVCGKGPETPEVRRELDLALARRADGALVILPIILRAGTVLPRGVDYEIQGIFLATLFPEIAYLRWAFAAFLGALMITTAMLVIAGFRREVAAELDRDRLDPASPLDFDRRDTMRALSRWSRWLDPGHSYDLAWRAQRHPPESSVVELARADDGRFALVPCGCGDRVVSAREHDLEVWDLQTLKLVRAVRLKRGEVVSLENDMLGNTVLVEVEYPHFADAEKDARVKGRVDELVLDGLPVRGQEREMFAYPCESEAKDLGSPLGKTVSLEGVPKHMANGDYLGVSHYAASPQQGHSFKTQPYSLQSLRSERGWSYAEVLAVNCKGDMLFLKREQISERQAAHYGATEYDGSPADLYRVSIVLRRVDGRLETVREESSLYWEGEGELSLFEATVSHESPNYEPAALDASAYRVVLRDEVLFVGSAEQHQVTLATPVPEVDSWRFNPRGTLLVGRLQDRTLAVFDPTTGSKLHTLWPSGLSERGQSLSPDGSWLFTLSDTGTLRALRLASFGPSGWAVAPPAPSVQGSANGLKSTDTSAR